MSGFRSQVLFQSSDLSYEIFWSWPQTWPHPSGIFDINCSHFLKSPWRSWNLKIQRIKNSVFLKNLDLCFTFFSWILNVPNDCILTMMSRVHWNLKINYCHDSELKLPYHKFLSDLSIPGHLALSPCVYIL